MAFEHHLRVLFDEVDYARVVYYPRLFEYTHRAFEEFFERELKVGYARMLMERKVGYPTVHAEADFRAPLRFGDRCRVVLECSGVTQRSISCRYRLYLADSPTLCAELKVVTAAIDMDAFRAVDVPDDVRRAFLKHLASDTSP